MQVHIPVTPHPTDLWKASVRAVARLHMILRAHDIFLDHPCKEAVVDESVLRPSFDEETYQTCQSSLLGITEFIRLLGEEIVLPFLFKIYALHRQLILQ